MFENYRMTGGASVQPSGFWPVQICEEDPPDLGTADIDCFGTGENGVDYAIKSCSKVKHLPATEYICTRLARHCGIAVPDCEIVRRIDGTLAFGSVWDGTAKPKALPEILDSNGQIKSASENFSKIYTFDLFVHNIDRHAGNYLCSCGRTPGTTLKAFDFSRAFLCIGWPLPALPLPPTCRTIEVGRKVRTKHPFVLPAAEAVLDRIDKSPFQTMKELIDAVPSEWMDKPLRKKILEWWPNKRAERTALIRKGLHDGTFL